MLTLKIVRGAEANEGGPAEVQVPPGLARFTIGRDPANHWVLADRTLAVSARHCEIVAGTGGMLLRDTSTNGTFVNGAAARVAGDHLLREGDRFDIGPYTVQAQGVPDRPAAVGAVAPAQAPAPAAPASTATAAAMPAARRGGDPAAMLSAAGAEPVRLTELLRAVPPPEDVAVEMTRIRAAPPAAAGAAPRAPMAAAASAAAPTPDTPAAPAWPAPVAVQPPAPGAATAAATSAEAPLLAALARGLGLPPGALQGRPADEVASDVAALARAAVAALRSVLMQQAASRRRIGSRSPALVPVRELHPWRTAATPEAALQQLLSPGTDGPAQLHAAAEAAAAHEQRLLAAFGDAAARLSGQLAPASLEPAAGGGAAAWRLYLEVWQGLGLDPARPWNDNFVEAALLHLATAYDDPATGSPR